MVITAGGNISFIARAKTKEKGTTTKTATAAKLESLKKTINLMSRIMDNMTGDDYEAQDAMSRAIRDASSDLFKLELSLWPEGELIAA